MGHANYELSDLGRKQAEALMGRFQKEGLQPTRVYSSPLRRAMETAEIIARSWTAAVESWDDLKELDTGVLTNLTSGEIRERYPEIEEKWRMSGQLAGVEDGESIVQQRNRAHRVVDAVVRLHSDDDSVVMVTHGGMLPHIISALLGTRGTWGMSVGNAAIFDFTFDLERWNQDGNNFTFPPVRRITRFNDFSHLRQ